MGRKYFNEFRKKKIRDFNFGRAIKISKLEEVMESSNKTSEIEEKTEIKDKTEININYLNPEIIKKIWCRRYRDNLKENNYFRCEN